MPDEFYSCTHKRRFTSKAKARQHGIRFRNGHVSRGKKKAGYTVYACEFCGGWHLATKRE